MIIFINECTSEPYSRLKEKYDLAISARESSVNAISIASFNSITKEVSSRYVNLKTVDNNKFIFFTNYNSPKSTDFESHNQIAASIYWPSINVQIRIKAKIQKTSTQYNDNYFSERSHKKNALAISSQQSEKIDSYTSVIKNYNKSLDAGNLKECPDFWGGYSFIPYYFEFWEGNESRLNKRDSYQINKDKWDHSILQP